MSYEVRDSVPGVRFEKDGKQGWVKVVRKKKGIKKKRGLKVGRGEEGSSSGSEVDVGEASEVVYMVDSDDEGPGLMVQRRRTREWIPIEPSPISTRTRARIT